jgi:NhaP-type Na+/H+ or K+/H+ antiporter
VWGIGRLALMIGVVVAGWLAAILTGFRVSADSTTYLALATALLIVGLYSSTHGISVRELRAGVGTVVLAVTVGVFAKAALIAGAMYAVYQEPRYAVLGLAVAQIDPLAVASMSRGSRMSDRAKSLLAAWASFDDPITVVLTVYGTAWLLQRGEGTGHRQTIASDAAAGSVGLSIAQNLLLAGLALAVWGLLQYARRRATTGRPEGKGTDRYAPNRVGGAISAIEVTLLVALFVVAVVYSLALGIALLGLFFRPHLTRWLGGLTQFAFLTACFLLGLALANGVHPRAGLLLGLAAYAAQILVGLVIPARISRRDRTYLSLGQQNGITAIILALLLEPAFPGTVGTVAPAILVVAILHTAANGLLDARVRRAGSAPEPGATPAGPSQPSPDPRGQPRWKLSHRSARGDGATVQRRATEPPVSPPGD